MCSIEVRAKAPPSAPLHCPQVRLCEITTSSGPPEITMGAFLAGFYTLVGMAGIDRSPPDFQEVPIGEMRTEIGCHGDITSHAVSGERAGSRRRTLMRVQQVPGMFGQMRSPQRLCVESGAVVFMRLPQDTRLAETLATRESAGISGRLQIKASLRARLLREVFEAKLSIRLFVERVCSNYRGTVPRTAHTRARSFSPSEAIRPLNTCSSLSRRADLRSLVRLATYAPAGPCFSRNGLQ